MGFRLLDRDINRPLFPNHIRHVVGILGEGPNYCSAAMFLRGKTTAGTHRTLFATHSTLWLKKEIVVLVEYSDDITANGIGKVRKAHKSNVMEVLNAN